MIRTLRINSLPVQGAVSMLPQADAELEIDPDPALEREAEEAAQRAMADGPATASYIGYKTYESMNAPAVENTDQYGQTEPQEK